MQRLVMIFSCLASVAFGQFPISGTFFMFDRDLSQEALGWELDQMTAVGIDTVVLLSVGRLNGQVSTGGVCSSLSTTGLLYPSGLVANSVPDRLGQFLDAATARGQKVIIGSLQTAGDWTNGTEFETLRICNKAVAQEILQRYGSKTSFGGLYFTQEIWLNWVKYYGQGYYGIAQLKNFVDDVSSLNPVTLVTTAPVFKKSGTGAMPGLTALEAATALGYLIYGSGIKHVMPQDGVGAQAGAPGLQEISSYYWAFKQNATGPNNVTLWSVLETFTNDGGNQDQYPPASLPRIYSQVTAEAPYVGKMVSWMFGHDMSGQATYHPVKAKDLYDQYRGHFLNFLTPLPVPFTYTFSAAPSASYPDNGKLVDGSGGGYGTGYLNSWVGWADTDTGNTVTIRMTLPLAYNASQVVGVRMLVRSETVSWVLLPNIVNVYGCIDSGPLQDCNLLASVTPQGNSPTYSVKWIEMPLTTNRRQIAVEYTFSGWLHLAELQLLIAGAIM